MATSIFETLRAGLLTHSAAESEAAAAALARELAPDTTLALHGDLGVGKTTFVRGLARGLGVREPITSPTFSLYSLYRAQETRDIPPIAARLSSAHASTSASTAPHSPQQLAPPEARPPQPAAPEIRPTTLLHLDAYRIETAVELEALLLEDFLISPWCLAIEWPENIADWLPPNALHLDLSITPTCAHHIRLRPPT